MRTGGEHHGSDSRTHTLTNSLAQPPFPGSIAVAILVRRVEYDFRNTLSTSSLGVLKVTFNVMGVVPAVLMLMDVVYRIKFGVVTTFGYRLAKRIYEYRHPTAV